MSDLEEVTDAAKSLDATDRLRLIARIWATLPRDHWAAPTAKELADVQRRLDDVDWDSLGDVPWIVFSRMTAAQPAKKTAKVYSAPRRFDLATIFAVTTAYAILFSCLRGLQFGPVACMLVAVFIALVGIGQAVLFEGQRPRKASIVVGAVVLPLGTLLFGLFGRGSGPEFFTVMAVMNIFWGSIGGYIAGVLVGGVFLVADAVRRWIRPSESPADLDAEDSAVSS